MPDIEQSIADRYADNPDVDVWLVDVGDSYSKAYDYIAEAEVGLPVLLDSDESLYSSYQRYEAGYGYGPFPFQLIIDGNGVIRYMANQYDPGAVNAQIDALLAE